jgi:hypothetical protein
MKTPVQKKLTKDQIAVGGSKLFDGFINFVFFVLFGITVARLHFAFDLFSHALGLQTIIADHLASHFFDLAAGLFNPAFDLILVHGVSLNGIKITWHWTVPMCRRTKQSAL